MILPRPQDAMHKTHLYRLLMGVIDDPILAKELYFKGGTCAMMAGWLDRFSLDLDFDLAPKASQKSVRTSLENLFNTLGFTVKQQSKDGLFTVLQYPAGEGDRNSIKVSVMTDVAKANLYNPLYLSEINRYALCQTKDTMVANKLVAPLSRYEKYKTIAGRDIYDIHYFLSHGFPFRKEIIRERRRIDPDKYLKQLAEFIDARVTDRTLSEDLNFLLHPARFRAIRKTLKEETLLLLRAAAK